MFEWYMTRRLAVLADAVSDGAGGGESAAANGDGGGAPDADAIKRARFEADSAKAEAAKLKRQIDEIKNQLPSDEQRQRWQELEAASEQAEEDRKKKAGEFDALREQLKDRHTKELQARDKAIEEAKQLAAQNEQELNSTLIGLAFSAASDWFGPQGKTVLMPDVAQSYFGRHVAVEKDERGARSIVVKDQHGNVLMDDKGQPMAFAAAMGELIESHAHRDHLMRGSGKAGSGSAGGAQGGGTTPNLRNLTPDQLRDPKVLEALKASLPKNAVVMGTAYER